MAIYYSRCKNCGRIVEKGAEVAYLGRSHCQDCVYFLKLGIPEVMKPDIYQPIMKPQEKEIQISTTRSIKFNRMTKERAERIKSRRRDQDG